MSGEAYKDEYKAPCFICKTVAPLPKLVRVGERLNKPPSEYFLICDICHCALWHAYKENDEKIYKELWKTKIMRERDKEFNDKARLNKVPISLEEICELAWELTYRGREFVDNVYKSLEKES